MGTLCWFEPVIKCRLWSPRRRLLSSALWSVLCKTRYMQVGVDVVTKFDQFSPPLCSFCSESSNLKVLESLQPFSDAVLSHDFVNVGNYHTLLLCRFSCIFVNVFPWTLSARWWDWISVEFVQSIWGVPKLTIPSPQGHRGVISMYFIWRQRRLALPLPGGFSSLYWPSERVIFSMKLTRPECAINVDSSILHYRMVFRVYLYLCSLVVDV
jgi:hypothetical protein